jgi:hypothetical protein
MEKSLKIKEEIGRGRGKNLKENFISLDQSFPGLHNNKQT